MKIHFACKKMLYYNSQKQIVEYFYNYTLYVEVNIITSKKTNRRIFLIFLTS